MPEKFELSQNYPNPFNPVTKLEFGISKLGFVTLKVYNSQGKEVATLVNEIKPAGRYDVTFDGSNFSSGVYFYNLESNGFIETKKMFLIK
ncbi:MAG: T9SS type A sorting domain-containing protein [Ignavibacteria bacterium]|nr:T9SS type A sorting domain-containing protein [Ignavibacteria bacterium]